MNLIIILCLCIIATSKVTIQGFFSKKNITSVLDGIFFNGLIFFFSALIFLRYAFPFNKPVLLFGAVFGFLTVLFQLSYINAMSCGNVSITVMLVNFSMIIPIAVSVIIYNEKLTVLRICGILLIVLAFVLSTGGKNENSYSKKWFLLSIIASLMNGSLLVCQKLFGKSDWAEENVSFVAYGYITATVISVLFCTVLYFKGNRITFKIKPSVFLYALSLGLILGLFQVINTRAIATIESSLLFPTYNGGSLILSSISGVLILHDRLNKKQLLSIVIGTIAIIIMNI